jgi:uncharacterized membrane protein
MIANIILLAVLFLLVLGLTAWTPYVTRRTELFGVSIPSAAADNEKCRNLRAAYRRRTLLAGGILGAAAALGILLSRDADRAFFIGISAVAGCLLLGFVFYLAGRRGAKGLKGEMETAGETVQLVVDTAPPAGDTLSPAWLLLYLLIPLLTVMGTAIAWPYAADSIPLHYNVRGDVDWAVPKSPSAVFPLLAAQAFILLCFTGVFFIIRRGKRQIDAANPEVSREQGRRFRRIMSAFALFGGVVLGSFFGGLQILTLLNASVGIILGLSLALLLAVVIVVVLLYVRVGQGGSRLSPVPRVRTGAANRDDDRYWKLGQFYVNPADPALFVEKRFGVGYTVNLARPAAWLLLGGLILLCAAGIALPAVLSAAK